MITSRFTYTCPNGHKQVQDVDDMLGPFIYVSCLTCEAEKVPCMHAIRECTIGSIDHSPRKRKGEKKA